MRLSVLSFNTFATPFFSKDITLRYKKFTQLLNQEPVDIVCLQEIQTYYHLSLLKKYLTAFPYLYYVKYIYGPKGGLVVASKKPFEKVNYYNFTKLGSFKNISFYTRLLQNGLLCCEMKEQHVMIINTHLVSDFEYDWSPENKHYDKVQSQVEQIVTEVNRWTSEGYSIILTGDFNMKKNSRLYNYFMEKTHATDTFHTHSSPTYYHTRVPYPFPGKVSERIDFIFSKHGKGSLQIKNTSELFDEEVAIQKDKMSYLSDHIGLKVDFDIV